MTTLSRFSTTILMLSMRKPWYFSGTAFFPVACR